MTYLSLSPAPCCSGALGGGGGRGSGEAGGAQILQLTVTCPLPLTTHTRVCQDRAVPQGFHRDPRPPGATRGCLSPSVSPPWVQPLAFARRATQLREPAWAEGGEGQIPGAGASQKRGSVSLERQCPQAPRAKLHGPWGLSGIHRSGDVKHGNVWEQVSGVGVQR